MDELVHHCFRELSFDGELGCDVSRLHDFIDGFYKHNSSTHCQNIDDAFCAFVWAVIVQQPGIRVGIVPPGAAAEVYIAPQVSAKKKAKAKGEEIVEDFGPATALKTIPDATIRSLEELRQEYGGGLRIAVDPETTFAAITGSHIRPSKLTPMVYTALQLITRGREQGISVLDLGKKSGYDQKTCFYLIKQLVDLDLVVKRRRPGVSTNICVHKYFFERSAVWKQVLEEEAQANAPQQADAKEEPEQDADEEDSAQHSLTAVHFDPIDSRHLSSLPLIRARLTKLLKNSPHYLHSYTNLLPKIGFAHPTKTDRRFFRSRLRELYEQRVVEKVQVPHADWKRFPDKKVTCIRLITADDSTPTSGDVLPIGDGDGAEPNEDDDKLKMNLTIHKQMIDLLDEAGTKGMTVTELSVALCDFDRRTVELLLSRLEKDPPPSHLGDLGIAQLGETHGRERRYKYYTIAHYQTVAANEKFEDSRYLDIDLDKTGGFLSIDKSQFYEDDATLVKYVDELKVGQDKGKKKRPVKNPTLPDGSIKKGRPRKPSTAAREVDGESGTVKAKQGKKRKRIDDDTKEAAAEESRELPLKRKRGRPPKQRDSHEVDKAKSQPGIVESNLTCFVPAESVTQERAGPRKRGRPRKRMLDHLPELDAKQCHADANPIQAKKRARGRPRRTDALREEPNPDTANHGNNEGGTQSISQNIPMQNHGQPLHMRHAEDSTFVHQSVDGILPQANVNSQSYLSPSSIENDLTRGREEQMASEDMVVRHSPRRPKSRLSDDGRTSLMDDPKPRKTGDAVQTSPGRPEEIPSPHSQGVKEANVGSGEVIAHSEEQMNANIDIPCRAHFATDITITQSSIAPDIPIDPLLLHGDTENPLGSRDPNILTSPQDVDTFLAAVKGDMTNEIHDDAGKRDRPDTVVLEPPSKRVKLSDHLGKLGKGYRSKANISQSRREKELLRIISESGGILNVSSKEFFEAHAALVESITKAGEVASTRPGSRLDKRTAEATLNDLEARQKVKLVTTSVRTSTGSNRPVRIVYLPNIAEDDVHAYLSNFSFQQFSPPAIKVLDERMTYGGASAGSRYQKLAPETRSLFLDRDSHSKDPALLQRFFQSDDDTIRDALLSEKNTLAQLYGFITGKAARARELHLSTIRLFELGTASTHIVSAEQRILDFSYYLSDLPISTYCALVSCLSNNNELCRLLESDSGRQIPVGKVSSEIRDSLQLTRWRSRHRILELFEMLSCLQLVDPLKPSQSGLPAITCVAKGRHPTTFDIAPADSWALPTRPLYCRFKSSAALHLWALPDDLPPFWKEVPLRSVTQCTDFWRELQKISIDYAYAKEVSFPTSGPQALSNTVLRNCLRRSSSWNTSYSLSWYQSEYLKQFVDKSNGCTPLQDIDGGRARTDRISRIISAPPEVVRRFFDGARKKHLREHDKARKRLERRTADAKAKVAETKALLAQKAAEARLQRERDWDDMVNRVHPEPLKGSVAIRVRRVRARYLQSSGRDTKKWEAEIAQSIHEATLVAKRILTSSKPASVMPFSASTVAPLPPVVFNPAEKAIEDLIAQQGPRLPARQSRKKSGKGKDTIRDEDSAVVPARRHRFQWNRDYDELAKDASAVIKARCRDSGRLDWAALEQVFPAVPRNSVRQRVVHLKETPGAETYQIRLEDKWYELWMQHRGTAALPDDDPGSATNFNLLAHIKFLRNHIDKNALRVGFFEAGKNTKIVLPATLDEMESKWEIVEKVPITPQWDFVWISSAEEGREKQLTQQAFLAEATEMPLVTDYPLERIHVADSALKMTMGTPNEIYDAQVATDLLESVGENSVQIATMNLLARGVLSKTVRDPQKLKPGRTLKISESNQNATGGSMPGDLFQDACALEEVVSQDDPHSWREWPLVSNDGDVAALLDLVSWNKVDFKIDTSHAQAARPAIDWNSKKADDDDIETSVFVHADSLHVSADPDRLVPPAETLDQEVEVSLDTQAGNTLEHEKSIDGNTAYCRQISHGLVDCQACLMARCSALLQESDPEQAEIIQRVLEVLQNAASSGLAKEQLSENVDHSQRALVFAAVDRMTDTALPLAYWTGYTSIVLVSAAYIRPWAVAITDSEGSKAMIFPRRWINIVGRKMSDVWEAAVRAVSGMVLFRPGVSQSEIRWRLRSVYDRQEVNDVLQYLHAEGFFTRRVDAGQELGPGPPNDREEQLVFWFVSDIKPWYHVCRT
ncbi:hypothetical protein AcV5_004217 [Taiwanofungus camphoratus]|nr:hypothetical protein AcV5_004217 [Antrodia cinnamomea]